jgi:hypothetical protein
MVRTRLATGLSLLGAAFILYIGIGYLLAPQSMAPGFGLPAWPHGDPAAFMLLKGVRDAVSGIVILALVLTGMRRALGVVLAVEALTPIGDMLTVLTHHGSAATAFGVHAVTAVLVAATAVLLLTEPAVAVAR